MEELRLYLKIVPIPGGVNCALFTEDDVPVKIHNATKIRVNDYTGAFAIIRQLRPEEPLDGLVATVEIDVPLKWIGLQNEEPGD